MTLSSKEIREAVGEAFEFGLAEGRRSAFIRTGQSLLIGGVLLQLLVIFCDFAKTREVYTLSTAGIISGIFLTGWFSLKN